MIDDEDLPRLGMGRWTVPMLAEIARHEGARFAVLLAVLGLPRDSLVRTLTYAMECGWIARNPGYGHPLRPEYVLTPSGKAVAETCVGLMVTRQRLGISPQSLPRWSLPIIGRLGDEWRRFSTLRESLATVTPRALSLNLKQMIVGQLAARRLVEEYPPTALYGLAPAGQELLLSLRSS